MIQSGMHGRSINECRSNDCRSYECRRNNCRSYDCRSNDCRSNETTPILRQTSDPSHEQSSVQNKLCSKHTKPLLHTDFPLHMCILNLDGNQMTFHLQIRQFQIKLFLFPTVLERWSNNCPSFVCIHPDLCLQRSSQHMLLQCCFTRWKSNQTGIYMWPV